MSMEGAEVLMAAVNTKEQEFPLDSEENIQLATCDKCGREFVDEDSLKLHRNLHNISDKHFTEAEIILRRELLYKEVRKQQDGDARPVLPTTNYKPRRIYRPLSKRVGLTKIRLEDCLRCDACSCIYIDEQDYYKHMRNFHQKYNTVIPRSRKKSPLHKCSVSCTEVHQQEQHVEDKKTSVTSTSFLLSDSYIKEKIKNRWTKVSQRLSSQSSHIKQEPQDDMGYLLSQVEVKIKTEPPEM